MHMMNHDITVHEKHFFHVQLVFLFLNTPSVQIAH